MLTHIFFLTLVIAQAVLAAIRNDPFKVHSDLVPNRYIVEFEPKQEQQQQQQQQSGVAEVSPCVATVLPEKVG